jgi:hypothetical protein
MNRRRSSAISVVLAGACLSALVAAPGANATPQDDAFANVVAQLGIPNDQGVSLPDVGNSICNMLNTGLQNSVDPVPVVRGVVRQLQSGGLSRAQAGGLLRAATDVYCPEHAALLGR